MTICKTCGYSSWCDCPKADDKNVNANELIKRMEDGYSVSYDEIIAMLRQFDLAESIIKQQEIQIEALKAEVKQWEEWKESLNGWSKK